MHRPLVAFGLTVLLSGCVGEMPTSPTSTVRVGADSQILLLEKSLGLSDADLDSIEVIKGAAASSVYGSSGCTAVIVVNTKRATLGVTH